MSGDVATPRDRDTSGPAAAALEELLPSEGCSSGRLPAQEDPFPAGGVALNDSFPAAGGAQEDPLPDGGGALNGSRLTEEEDLLMHGHKSEEEDLLVHGHKSDLKWALKDYRPPRYRYLRYRAPIQIKEEVLQSNRVRRVISLLCRESGQSEDQLNTQAMAILEEMGHEFSEGVLRCIGMLMRKVFRKILTKVVVDKGEMTALARLSAHSPLLIMPNHRSYLDFMLVTWILYSYDIKTPVIAAGMDFMFMRGVGELLRRCGAYFIRRSFGKDKLYWALFTEYTQTHVINGDAPVEFFIEGTRSRTGKSLQPKFGMLTIALEPYFDARVSDVTICPVSLSYERTVEESLHVRELMGVPKPKESTRGLLRAHTVLNNNYGTIYVRVGASLSVHKMAAERGVDRKVRALFPRAVIPSVQPHERSFVNELAYRIIREQQNGAVTFPCSVLACVLLSHLQRGVWSLPAQQVREEVVWAGRLLSSLGCCTVSSHSSSPEEEDWLEHSVQMLSPVVSLSQGGQLLSVEKNPEGCEHLTSSFRLCYSFISLGRRRNELLHSVITLSILSLLLQHPKVDSCLRGQFLRLRRLLSAEFIFMPGQEEGDLDGALASLAPYLSRTNGTYRWMAGPERSFLCSLLRPFLETYLTSWQFALSYLPRTEGHGQGVSEFCRRIQTYLSVLQSATEGVNLSVIENSLVGLSRLGVLHMSKDRSNMYCNDPAGLSDLIGEVALILNPLPAKL